MRLILRLLLLLIVLALLLGLVLWHLPLSFAYRHLGDRIGPAVSLQDLSGSVRQGRAGQVLVNGFPVGALGWTLDWRELLARRVGGSWRLQGPAWEAAAERTRMVDGALEIDGLSARFPALLLQPVLDIPALNFLGTVELDVERLLQRDGLILQARGQARWVDAGVTGQAQARFGPVRASFASAEAGRIIGEIKDEGGPLLVDGQFELTGRHYQAEVILRARNPADPVAQALLYIGQALPDGGSLLIIEGELREQDLPAQPGGG